MSSTFASTCKDGDTLFHIASKTGPAQMALIFMKKGIPMHMSNKVRIRVFAISKMKSNNIVLSSKERRQSHTHGCRSRSCRRGQDNPTERRTSGRANKRKHEFEYND